MSSQGNEILSLAFGHYSCHLATHFFNIQEASFSYNPNFSTGINHDILFRESLLKSQSISPRLIAVDDESSLGFLSREGYFKEIKEGVLEENCSESNAPNEGSSWMMNETGGEGSFTPIVKQPLWEKNDFLFDYLKEKQRLKSDASTSGDFLLKSSYNLDETVVSWSDYLITEFNERTIVPMPKNTEYYEKYDTFSSFDSGLSLWQKTLIDDVEENIRFYLEESDNLQGFQVLTDGGNGYSGISSGCVELLRDEYSKKAIIMVPAIFIDSTKSEDVKTKFKNRCDRIYSLASSLSSFAEFCDIIAPMSHLYDPWSKDPTVRLFRNVDYKHDLMYHTSAIMAAALDLTTLSCRTQNRTFNLNSLSSFLNIHGRSFISVGLNVPLPVRRNEDMLPPLEKIPSRFFESITPMIDLGSEFIDVQSVSMKGLGKNHTPDFHKIDRVLLKEIEDKFHVYLNHFYPRTLKQLSSCKSGFRVPRTFPKILNKNFDLTNPSHEFGPLSEYISVGSLDNTKEMYGMLNNLYQEAKAIGKKSIAGFRPRDSDIDHEELFEQLKTSTQAYVENMFL